MTSAYKPPNATVGCELHESAENLHYYENIRSQIREFLRPVETGYVVKLFGLAFKSAASYSVSENGFKATKKKARLEEKAKRLQALAAAALELRAYQTAETATAIVTTTCQAVFEMPPIAEPVETPNRLLHQKTLMKVFYIFSRNKCQHLLFNKFFNSFQEL